MNIVQLPASMRAELLHIALELYDRYQPSAMPKKSSYTHNMENVYYKNNFNLHTAKGSACSQLIGVPQVDGRIFSGKLSGTATNIKNTSKMAIAVARATTSVSLYFSISVVPKAGEITCIE